MGTQTEPVERVAWMQTSCAQSRRRARSTWARTDSPNAQPFQRILEPVSPQGNRVRRTPLVQHQPAIKVEAVTADIINAASSAADNPFRRILLDSSLDSHEAISRIIRGKAQTGGRCRFWLQ